MAKFYIPNAVFFFIFIFFLHYHLLAQKPLENQIDTSFAEEDDLETPFQYGGFFRHGINSFFRKDTLVTSFSTIRGNMGYKKYDFQAHLDADLDFIFSNRGNSDEFISLWNIYPQNRLFPLEGSLEEEEFLFRYSVHRLFIAYSIKNFSIMIGRQAISWGQGRFLNPLDLITPIDALTLDFESVPGADSIDLSYYINDTDFIQFVGVPYRRKGDKNYLHLRIEDVNALIRYKSTWEDVDISIVSGYHFHSWVWGGEFAWGIGGAIIRGIYLERYESEYSINISDLFGLEFSLDQTSVSGIELRQNELILENKVSRQGVIGASYAFWGELMASTELFINGASGSKFNAERNLSQYEAGVSAGLFDPLPSGIGFFRTAGRLLTKKIIFWQMSLSYQFFSVYQASLFFIYDLQGNSILLLPQIQYDLNDETIIILSSRIFFYAEGSEFDGAVSDIYTYIRTHF